MGWNATGLCVTCISVKSGQTFGSCLKVEDCNFFFSLIQFGCCQESLTRVLRHLFNWELSCRLWQCCENYLLLDEFLLGYNFLICPESRAIF